MATDDKIRDEKLILTNKQQIYHYFLLEKLKNMNIL